MPGKQHQKHRQANREKRRGTLKPGNRQMTETLKAASASLEKTGAFVQVTFPIATVISPDGRKRREFNLQNSQSAAEFFMLAKEASQINP
ncbi:MAG: hypothetical protein ABH986_06615 [archaeon]